MATQDKLSKTVARNQARRNRIRNLNQKIKNEKDPNKKAALIAKRDKVQGDLAKGKTKAKGLRGDVSIEGVVGPGNVAAAQAAADKWTPTLDRVHTGVLGYDPVTGNPIRIGENQEVLDRYRSVMEKGMEAPEYQAEREQMSAGLTSDYRTAASELAKAQARSKVYGAAGAAQSANLARADSEKRADLEQQLFLKGTQLKRDYLDKYSGALAGMQDFEMQGEKVNVGQKNAEEATRLGILFNVMGAGMGKDYQKQMLEIQNKALDAAMTPLEFPEVDTGTKEPTTTTDTTGGGSAGTEGTENVDVGEDVQVNVDKTKRAALTKSNTTNNLAKLRAKNQRLRNKNKNLRNRLSGAAA